MDDIQQSNLQAFNGGLHAYTCNLQVGNLQPSQVVCKLLNVLYKLLHVTNKLLKIFY
jgi:hypothetical protein